MMVNSCNMEQSQTKKSKRKHDTTSKTKSKKEFNPLFNAQSDFLMKLPGTLKSNFFDDSKVNADTRGELWSEQADIGEDLVNQYSWATPDERSLRILQHFAPIVEIGCG